MAQLPKSLLTDALLYPSTMVVPSVAQTTQFAPTMTAGMRPFNDQRSVADWMDNPIVQKGYVMKPWADGKYRNSMVLSGDPVSVRRSALDVRESAGGGRGPSVDAQSFTIATIAQVNLLERELYQEAVDYFAPLLERGRGLDLLGDAQYLTMTEPVLAMKAEYDDPDDEGLPSAKVKRYLQCFSKAAMLDKWNLLGIANLDAAEGTPEQGFYPYYPLNVIYKGPRLVRNYFGEGAVPAANCYFVLKRRSLEHDPSSLRRYAYDDRVEHGAFGWHPGATLASEVPLEERAYRDLSGAPQVGHVQMFCLVQDCRNRAPPSATTVARVSGLHPESSPGEAYETARVLPLIDATLSHKYHQRYLY